MRRARQAPVEVDVGRPHRLLVTLPHLPHPREPVGALLPVAQRQQVPAPALGDQPDRVDRAPPRLLVARGVAQVQPTSGEHGGADGRRAPRRRPGSRSVPVHAAATRPSCTRIRPASRPADLPLRRAGSPATTLRIADASAGAMPAPSPARPGDEQGERLVVGEPGEVGRVARQQREAAVSSALGVHGHARGGERLDVAQHGARRHLQLVGQLLGRPPPPVLEQQEEREETVGAHDREHRRKT